MGDAVTIRDVARRANVSVATVSRALNGHAQRGRARSANASSASPRSSRTVPHHAARSLSSRRTHTIGVVLPDLHGEFFSELIRGIDGVAREHGLHLLVSSYHGHPEEQGDRAARDAWARRRPAGDVALRRRRQASCASELVASASRRARSTRICTGVGLSRARHRQLRRRARDDAAPGRQRLPPHRVHHRSRRTTSTPTNACAVITTRSPSLARAQPIGVAGRVRRSLRPRARDGAVARDRSRVPMRCSPPTT